MLDPTVHTFRLINMTKGLQFFVVGPLRTTGKCLVGVSVWRCYS